MANLHPRCKVNLGDLLDPDAPRHAVREIRDVAVRSAIEGYLELTGVLLGRSNPKGWFIWLYPPPARVFVTRCGDPPAPGASDHKWESWRYYVEAEVSAPGPCAKATSFFHEDLLNI